MADTFAMVTDRIIAALEKGVIPWKKPWAGTSGAISHVTGKKYSLLNQLLLEDPGEYITFKQAVEEGGHVKKGEKGKFVVFWKWLDKKDEDGKIIIGDNGQPEKIPYLKYYTVFNISQCEGIDPKYIVSLPVQSDLKPDGKAERILQGYIDRSKVTFVSKECDQAYYSPMADTIVVPLLSQFGDIAEYYSTVFHEAAHSTGHRSRLDRLNTVAGFGSEEYSKEELIAELGAGFLVNHAGLESSDSFANNAAYINNWLKALRNDKKFIVSAASKAEKAVNMILGDEEKEDEGNV